MFLKIHPFHLKDDTSEDIDIANSNHYSNTSQHVQDKSQSYDSTVEEQLKILSSLKGCKIAHLNILSLLKNIDELKLMLKNSSIDILTLSETHLDNNITDGSISIEGFNCVRRDRNRSGGGVLVYIRDDIHFTIKSEFMQIE